MIFRHTRNKLTRLDNLKETRLVYTIIILKNSLHLSGG